MPAELLTYAQMVERFPDLYDPNNPDFEDKKYITGPPEEVAAAVSVTHSIKFNGVEIASFEENGDDAVDFAGECIHSTVINFLGKPIQVEGTTGHIIHIVVLY